MLEASSSDQLPVPTMKTKQDIVSARQAPPLPHVPEISLRHLRWKLFVANIDPAISLDKKLKPLLQRFGQMDHLIIKTAPSGMLSAIVFYRDPESLAKAKDWLNGVKVGFSRMYAAAPIRPATLPTAMTNPSVLFIRNFSEYIDKTLLFDLCRPYGSLDRFEIYRSVYGYRFAIVSYNSWRNRDCALRGLHGYGLSDGYTLEATLPPTGRQPDLGPVSPAMFRRAHCERSAKNVVRATGVSPSLTNDSIHAMFAHYGNLQDFHLLRGCDLRWFGCIIMRYSMREEANTAIIALNNKEVGGQKLKMTLVRPSALPTAYEVR